MAAKAFWPGYKWRILAHHKTEPSANSAYTGKQVEMHSTDFDTAVEFDELVIDSWLHLEQMSDRSYWIGLGTAEDGVGYEYMVYIKIDRDGKATTQIERDG